MTTGESELNRRSSNSSSAWSTSSGERSTMPLRNCETVSFQIPPHRPRRRATSRRGPRPARRPGRRRRSRRRRAARSRASKPLRAASVALCAAATRANSSHAASSMCGSGATAPKSISSATSHPPGLSAPISRWSAAAGSASHASRSRMWITSKWALGSSSAITSWTRTSRSGRASSRSCVTSRSVASTLPWLPTRWCSQVAIDPPPAPTSRQCHPGWTNSSCRIVPASSSASSVRSRSRWPGIAFSNAYSAISGDGSASTARAIRAGDRSLAAS